MGFNICASGHEEIVFEGHGCPLCDAIDTRHSIIIDLEDSIKDLKEQIDDLESSIKERESINLL